VKQRDGYLYYQKRGPGDEYWNTYRRPLQLQHVAANTGGNPAGSGKLAQAVAAAAAAAIAKAAAGGSSASSEELVLDENDLSAQHQYWDADVVEVSPDGCRDWQPDQTSLEMSATACRWVLVPGHTAAAHNS